MTDSLYSFISLSLMEFSQAAEEQMLCSCSTFQTGCYGRSCLNQRPSVCVLKATKLDTC